MNKTDLSLGTIGLKAVVLSKFKDREFTIEDISLFVVNEPYAYIEHTLKKLLEIGFLVKMDETHYRKA